VPAVPVQHNGQRGRVAKSDAHNLWKHLKEHESIILLFANPHIPFANNRAKQNSGQAKDLGRLP
jgi:transposase